MTTDDAASADATPSGGTVPTTTKRFVLVKPGPDVSSCQFEVQTNVPVPVPGPGEVLVKVVAASINPSDYGTWIRTAEDKCPLALGSEGCGVVAAVGPTDWATTLITGGGYKVGQKLGFIGLKDGQGAYSEYVLLRKPGEGGAFPIPDNVKIEDAASFFVNPYTAIGIFDTAVRLENNCRVIVHTAAASQLGQMMVKLAPSENMEIINVVRRQEQADMLQNDLKAKHVVVVTGPDDAAGMKQLKAKVDELGATVAFDAVGGAMTGALLDIMPNKKGVVYVYGVLDGAKVCGIDQMDLIYRQKKLKGFGLAAWVQAGGMFSTIPRMYAASRKVNSGLVPGGWSSTQFVDTTMEKAQADLLSLLQGTATNKKLRIRFDT
jgi:NADPH:quinone reductase